MKKTTILLFLMAAMLATFASAEEAGTTPESPLWGIDVALDKIRLGMTLDDSKRAEKALQIAEERLAELQEMAEKKRFDLSEKAREEHSKLLEEAEKRIEKASKRDKRQQFENELRLEERLESHKARLLELNVEGELNPEQQAALDRLVEVLGDNVRKLEIKLVMKQNRTRTELESEIGANETERLEMDRWQKHALNTQEQAEREIAKAKAKIELFESRLEGKPVNNTQNLELLSERDKLKERLELAEKERERLKEELRKLEERKRVMSSITGDVVSDMPVESNNSDNSSTEPGNTTEPGTNMPYTNLTDSNTTEPPMQGNETAQGGGDDGDAEEVEAIEVELETEDEVELEDKLEVDDNILAVYNLTVPEYANRTIDTAKRYVAAAEDALNTSKRLYASEDYRQSYAYAKLAKKLAQAALSGKYLVEFSDRDDLKERIVKDEMRQAEKRAQELRDQEKTDLKRAEEARRIAYEKDKLEAKRLEEQRWKEIEEAKEEARRAESDD